MKKFHFQAVSRQVLGDLHTLVSLYLKVRDLYPESVLLESSDFHSAENSLSFIGIRPIASFSVNDGCCTLAFPDRTREQRPVQDGADIGNALSGFLSSLDVTGEARAVCGLFGYTSFNAVRYFIDDAIMLGVPRVRILHGTGTGALRQLIRQYLGVTPGVHSFRDEHVQLGGAGITVVDLE